MYKQIVIVRGASFHENIDSGGNCSVLWANKKFRKVTSLYVNTGFGTSVSPNFLRNALVFTFVLGFN